MKKILIIITATLFIPLTAKGQNFFFIGENSYPSTETFTLKSNSDDSDINDLNVLFAKDGAKGLIIVSSKLVSTVRISGKLIIYLDDGTVISSDEEVINDNVNDIASSVYYLTDEELIKMKNSNINTIRYVIKCAECLINPLYEGNFSASNKGRSRIDFPALVSEFFMEQILNQHQRIQSEKNKSNKDKGEQEADKSAPYELKWEGDLERSPVIQPLPDNTSGVEATITIRFEVKPGGMIGRIIPLRKMNPELKREVMHTLRNWRFSQLPAGVPQQSQWGTITFRFVLE